MHAPRSAFAARSRFALLVVALTAVSSSTSDAASAAWTSSVSFTNIVASAPVMGGGYPVPPGATAPTPGTCGPQALDSNRSESWLAVKPGTEELVGASKFFVSKWSTFYDFHLGSYTFKDGAVVAQNQVQGYDCTTVGTQDMPPSWTNNTDPTVDFDTKGRVYQVTLPFNAYWTNLHPNSAIDISYSDDMGRTWMKGNGGEDLEHTPNWSSLSLGYVEDKQWIAVNRVPGTRQDWVYAAWGLYDGQNAKLRITRSKDRGQTFSKTFTFTAPSDTGPLNEYVQPAIDADGDLYMAYTSSEHNAKGGVFHLWVSKVNDDGTTISFDAPVEAASAAKIDGCCLPNTTFRDGIELSFAASPTHAGHLYLAYEVWDTTHGQFDVLFTQSTDGGQSWSAPRKVNDNAESARLGYTDQFQPEVAAGPDGAVAVAFYDRRQACPSGRSIRTQDVGRTNFCIDTSLQAFTDSGSGAVPVLGNVRITKYTWDPMQPDQHVDGIGQMACASHRDPCTTNAFIGDYFGLAVSQGNIYALFVSTHYPSSVTADEGGPVYYQQQILATVPRAAFGSGY